MSGTSLPASSQERELPIETPLAGSMARGAGMVLLLATLPRLATLIQGTLFCRLLPKESLGQWEMAYKFALLAAPLAVLGIPGSLGRFVEPYRACGRLRILLTKSLLASAATSLVVVGLFAMTRPLVAQLIFGGPEFSGLIGPWLVGLVGLIAYNTLTTVFLSLHLFRSAFWLQFGQSLMFGLVGWALFEYQSASTVSAIWAFAVSNLLAAAIVLPGLRHHWQRLDHHPMEPADATFLPRIVRFALWLWLTNLLMNGFDLADRFVLVQFSSRNPLDAHAELGQYHAALLLPKFFPALANLLSAALLPRFARIWDTQGNQAVSRRLNLTVKLFALLLMTGAVSLLGLAPWVFKVLGGVSDKFQQGQTLLPWTLALSIWGSLVLLVQLYLWCREHNGKVMLAIAIGLAVNLITSLLLVKPLGLWGAVCGATAANLVALLLMLAFCWRQGLQRDAGLLLVVSLPGTLWFGFWPALLVLLLTLAAFALSGRLLDSADRQFLGGLARAIRYRR